MKKKLDIKTVLKIQDLSFNFASIQVLSNISFSIKKGDFVGLIGPNGSGKTTLLKLILGLYSTQSGKIELFGKNIKNFSDWSKIGYVPQKVSQIEDNFPASVKEIVQMGLLSSKNFPRRYFSSDNKKVINVLKKVGMQDFLNRRISELSGGQQQRIFIARSLISNPEILILDEPTTGVDQKNQNLFYDLLGKLNKEGITILLVSHDLSRITNYVNKVASLNGGLEFYGTHKDFCKHPNHESDHHCLTIGEYNHD